MKKVAFYECFYDEASGELFKVDMITKIKVKGSKKPVAIVKDFNGDYCQMTMKTLISLAGIPEVGYRKIDGFMDYYEIDINGNLFSKKAKRIIKPTIDSQGKYKSRLRFDITSSSGVRKSLFLHRALAIAFIPNPEGKPEVNHIDGNPMNNNVSNLEWVTKQENVSHAQRNYLYTGSQKEVSVYDKNDKFIGSYESMQKAADVLGMKSKNANKNISEVCKKNADKDMINSRHALGLFMSEGFVFKYKG
jgi:hypothetical protein